MVSTIELAARLSAVVAAQQDILATVNDPDALMRVIAARVPELVNGAGAAIALREGDALVIRSLSRNAPPLDTRIPIAGSAAGEALREKRAIRCDDTATDPRVESGAFRLFGVRSYIVAPIVDGVLQAFSPQPNAFGDLDAYILQLLAGLASAALMQAREYRARQASEQRYRMLFESNVAGVFRTTLDGRILDCNNALAGFLGYRSREELLSRDVWDLYHQRRDREEFLEHLQRGRALTNLRLRLKKKDGSSITGVVNVSMIPAEDGETQVLGTLVEET
jgi:PAS domain S-box-containing protein